MNKADREDIVRYILREDYLYDCNFIAHIGTQKFGFSKISNLVINSDVETKFGDSNTLIPMQKKNRSLETLKLEKGLTRMKADAFENHYTEGKLIKDMIIFVLDHYKLPEMAFYFDSGMITSKSYSNLDAKSGNILMMTMVIKHTGLKEIRFS